MKSKTDKRLLSKLIAATLMGTVGLSMYSVSAADPAESLPLGEGSSATHESVAIGTNAQATTSSNAIGIGAKASGSSSVLGNGAQAVAGGVAIGKEAVAGIGKEGSNEIIVGGVAVGQSANAALGGIAIGSSATTKNISDVVIGSNSKNNGAGSTIIGYGTEGNRSSVVVGTNSKAGLNALSIGYEAEASQFAATALGSQSKVTAMQGVALGSSTVADTASGKTGYLANKTQTANVAKSVYTSTNGAVSVGKTNEITRQITNVAAGTEDTDVVNVRQLKDLDLAVDNKISTQLSAVNTQLDGKLDADALQYVSIKSTETGTGSNEDNLGANGANSIAIGPKAVAKYTADVAMGLNANAHGFYSIALGRDSETTGSSSVAVGDGAKSKTNETVAIGKKAITNSIGSISIGKDATTATDSMAAMAIGYETNATGVAATAMGAQAKALSKSATAVGFDAVIQNASNGSGRTGNNAVAMGVSSKVDGGNGGIAIGNNANVIDTNQATVVGTGAMVSALPENSGDSVVITDGSSGTKTITKGDDGTYTVVPTKDSVESLKQRNGNAYGATALGSRATAHNLGAVAAGLYATAIGDTSVAIGNNSMTLADSATAVGASATATAEDSMVLGGYTNANIDTAVALGSYAKTDRAAGEQVGYNPATNAASTEDDATWKSTLGAVSVGNSTAGKTRHITNVAAGFADTDAVNVAQLKNVSLKVTGDNLKTDATAIGNVNLASQQLAINGDSNITTTVAKDGQSVNLALSKTVTDKLGAVQYFSVNSTEASNKDNKGATKTGAIAIGAKAGATNWYDIAIGNNARSSDSWSIALGSDANVSGTTATAIGYGAQSTNDQTIALGYMANASGQQATAIGREANAAGGVSIALGTQTHANADDSVAIGRKSSVASQGVNSIAIGQEAYIGKKTEQGGTPAEGVLDHSLSIVDNDTSSGKENQEYMNSIAIGSTAKSYGYQNTVLGVGAEAHDTNDVAIGVLAKAKGHYATAMGKQANANGLEATALGHWARAYGDNAIAIGSYAITSTLDGTGEVKNGIAIGKQARVASNNSVALGQNSLAFVPTDLKTKAYLSEEEFAAENGVISVGNAEYTVGDVSVAENRRRITNVAGGADDYDAVNVKQLKAAKVEVIAGGNVTVDTDTTAGYTKYTVNSVDIDTKIVDGTAIYNDNGTGSITLNTEQDGTKGKVSVTGLHDKYITGASLTGNTLTINRNDGENFTVENIATKDDVTTAVGDSSWTLGVAKVPSITTVGDSEATAVGTPTEIKNGNTVTLRAERGIKLNQDGSNIDIGLKYIDVDPAVDAQPLGVSDAKASGAATLAVGQNSIADGHQGTAVGFSSHAGEYSLAVGSRADASAARSLALGYNTSAGVFGVAAGSQAKATGQQSIAVGTYTQTNGVNSIGIGMSAKKEGATSDSPSDFEIKTNSDRAIAIGRGTYVGLKAKKATAIGVGNKIMGGTTNTSNNAVLLGTSSSITEGQSSLLLGNKASINKSQNAVGVGSQSSIKNSMAGTAVGYLAIAKDAEQGTAIGGGSIVSAKQATAVGGSSEVSAAQGVAIGYKSNAGVAHGVALGTYSQATRANNYMGYNPLTGTVMENDEAAIAKVLGREADLEAYNATMQNSDPKSQEYLEAKTNKEILLSAYKSGMSAVSVGRVNLTRQITNVAAGTADTDAVNVAQLKAAKVEVAAGANVTVDTDTSLGYTKYTVNSVDTDTKLVDGTVTYGNDGVGSITLNTEQNGTTGTVSVTGLHDKYITGASMTGNTLTINRNDGENFTVTNIATKDDVNTAAGSKIDTFTVGTDAAAQANGIDVDKENTRFDILGANENITTEIAGRQVKIGLANTLNLTDAGSISFGNGANAAKVDASGLTISEQLKFTNDGISAGNQTIDNVKSAISDKAGTQFTDKLNAANESNPNSAVNVSDLKQTAEALTGQIGDANTAANSKLESFVVGADKNSTAAGITVDKGTEGKTNRFDIVGADENITTKVNGNTIEVGLAKDITLNDGSVTTTKDGVTTKVDGTGVTITPSNGDASKSVSLTNEGLNNGGNKITNVADGDVSASSKDAVNGSQLHAVKEELKGDINDLESKLGAAGDLTKVDQNGNPVVTGNDGKNYNPSDVDENGNPKDGAKPVESTLGSGADTSGLGLDNKDNSKPITEQEAKDIVGGTPGADGQPGKDGLLDKTGPSLSNLATIKDLQAVAQAGLDFGSDTGDTAHRALSQKLTINGGISNEEQLTDNNIGVVSNGSDTLTVKLAKDINLGKDGSVTTGNTTINNDGLTVKGEDGKPGTTVGSDGMVVNGDDGKPATTVGKDGISTNGKDGISVNGEDGSSTTIKPDGVTSKDPNGNSTVFGPNGVEVKDKDGNTVVTINDQGISNSNGGPTNLNDGLNVPGGLVVTPGKEVNGQYVPGSISAEGNRIQNVAPGIEATDAVNVGQLGGVKRDLSNRMNTIGAHAAAMAALHPMEYLEDEKLSVAAGVGTFHSKQAVAVGAFYRPNDDTMFSVGGSFGGSENMFNLGVSLRVGQDSDYAKAAQNYKQAPLSTMTVLDEKVTNLEKENAALKGQLEEQREQIKLLMERLGV